MSDGYLTLPLHTARHAKFGLGPRLIVRAEVFPKKTIFSVQEHGLASLKKPSPRQIERALVPVLITLSEEIGFDVAMPGSQIIFANKSLDITGEVLSRLNEKLPSGSVTLPSVD